MDRQSTSSSSNAKLKEFGAWTEQYSSSGKRYFYNRETEISQWDKPTEWRDYEKYLAENAASHSPISSTSGVRAATSTVSTGQQHQTCVTSTTHSSNLDAKNRAKAREISQPTQAPRTKRPKIEVEEDVEPVVFSEDQHRRFLRADAHTSTRRWPAEDWEQSSLKADAAAHNLTLQIIYLSCDLKSARSLVKTAEMRSLLLAQRLQFIADHQRKLEASLTMPTVSINNNY